MALVLAVGAGAAGYLAYDLVGPGAPGRTAGQAPAFTLLGLSGEPQASAEWTGRPRVINFWATWCPPCRREIPLLIDLQAEHGEDLAVIGIAIDDLEAVRDYARDMEFNYPVLVGQQDAVAVGNAYLENFVGLPFTAFVDASGRLVRVHMGELHRTQAEAFIAEIM